MIPPHRIFDQGKVWTGADGLIQIKDMSDRHRRNVARLLMRETERILDAIAWSEFNALREASEDVVIDWFREMHEREADPQKWMASTKLYKRMIKDLPPESPSGLF